MEKIQPNTKQTRPNTKQNYILFTKENNVMPEILSTNYRRFKIADYEKLYSDSADATRDKVVRVQRLLNSMMKP